jgi:hypothetical protein
MKMHQIHWFKRNKNAKSKKRTIIPSRRRYTLRGGVGSHSSSSSSSSSSPKSSPHETYDDAELLLPVTDIATQAPRTRKLQYHNPLNSLGPFKHNIARRLGSSGIPGMMSEMTAQQRRFLRKIATRKSFGDKIMKRLIHNNNTSPYYHARALAHLKKMTTNRIASSLISDTTAPYGLDRVINVSGNPRCVILDSDGNIVVSINKQGVSAERIHVFRYNDGEHLRTMHATSNPVGEIVFRNDKNLVFLEDRDITFLNYSNGRMNKQIFKPHLSHHTITFDKDKKNIIMGFNRIDHEYRMATFHGLVMIDADNGREISTAFDDKFRDIGGLTFDPQGRLVVILNSTVEIYDYMPSKRPFIKNWRTINFHSDSKPHSVAFDENGNMLVVDANCVVGVFKYPEMKLLHSIDCRAKSDKRNCKSYSVTAGPNGDILVCDYINMCIKIFTQRL